MRAGALALALSSRWPGCPSGLGPPCSGVPTLPILTTCAPAKASCHTLGLISCIRHRPGGAKVGETTGVGATCSSWIWPASTPTHVFSWDPGEPQARWVSPSGALVARAPSGHPSPGWLAQHALSALGPQFLCWARIGGLESPSPWGCPPAPALDHAGVRWCCRVGGWGAV